jgi:hypothetical protein
VRKRFGLVVGVLGAAAVVSGCGGSGGSSQKQTSVPPKPKSEGGGMMSADTGARLRAVAPTAGTVVRGNGVPIRVGISNFDVDCRFAGTPNRAGVGHYHVELDGSLINMFCSPRDRVSLQNVKPGQHTLTFIPAENDHTDDLKAEKKVAFSYQPSKPLAAITAEGKAGPPSIRVLSPRPGATVSGSFVMKVAPKNFEFSCALYGKPNVAGYGHWHANVDSTTKGMMGMGTMLGMSCSNSFRVSLAGIKPGKHTFYAILEDNQHAPTPKAQDSVTVDVR